MSKTKSPGRKNQMHDSNETFNERYLQDLHAPGLPPDSDGLGAIRAGNFRIGCAPKVNGDGGALEENGFVPTRHELSIVARYWLEEVLTLNFDWFCYRQAGGSEMRVRPYAYRRLARVERILGADAIKSLEREVMSQRAAKENPWLWKMFLEGEEPARDEDGLPVPTPPE
jgi:hypothetical protein